jgi:RNA polymerase sigma-70 factor (ECF subfamily)
MDSNQQQETGCTGVEADEAAKARAQELSRLVEEHNRALHAFLMTRLRDEQEAKDVAQEAYVQVLQLNEPGAINFLRAYLFKTAANIAINRAKQRSVRGRLDELEAHEEPVDRRSPERWALAAEEVEIFRGALFELPPKCRRAFVLHRFKEWDVERIAEDLGIRPRMVRHYLLQAGLYCKLRIRGLSPMDAKAEVYK